MNQFYVYGLYDPQTGLPFYIGKGSGNRAISHLTDTKKARENPRRFNKINKLRSQGIEPEVRYLRENLSESEAFDYEEEQIRRYGRKGIEPDGVLTNLMLEARPPIRTGKLHSDTTKEKMSQAAKGRKKSPEHCKNIGLSKKGENHPNWGKSLGDEIVEKIRLGNIGVKRSAKSKLNIAKGHAVTYEITSPEGKRKTLDSVELKKLCEAFGFNKGSFVNACRIGNTYKGWTIKRI